VSFIYYIPIFRQSDRSAANVNLSDLCGSTVTRVSGYVSTAVIHCSVNIVTFKFYYRLNLATRCCPKFTFPTFTPDPNLHTPHIYTRPKFTQTQKAPRVWFECRTRFEDTRFECGLRLPNSNVACGSKCTRLRRFAFFVCKFGLRKFGLCKFGFCVNLGRVNLGCLKSVQKCECKFGPV